MNNTIARGYRKGMISALICAVIITLVACNEKNKNTTTLVPETRTESTSREITAEDVTIKETEKKESDKESEAGSKQTEEGTKEKQVNTISEEVQDTDEAARNAVGIAKANLQKARNGGV